MVVDEEDLIDVLQKAYEAGYYGTLELAKDEIQFLLNEVKEKSSKKEALNQCVPYYTTYGNSSYVYVPG